jgi:hypothetical protein
MKTIIMTDQQSKLYETITIKEIIRSYQKFAMKKLSHYRNPELRSFFKNYCDHNFRQLLYGINFSCHFSFYLYLHLKKKALPFEIESPSKPFTISQPVDLNLTQISRLTGISRNTIKKAYKELCRKKLILETGYITKRNKPKKVMIVNDYYFVGYEKSDEKVYYRFDF